MPANLYELLREQAARRGSRTFVVFDGAEISYAEALAATDALAGALKRRGVKKGDRFALALRNHPAFLYAYLALSRLGAAALPVNFMVTKGEELSYLLNDSGAVGLLTQAEFLRHYEKIRAEVPGVKVWLGLDAAPEKGERLQALLDEKQPAQGPSEAGPDDLAVILYTSGTTGKPKGAMLTHANMLSNARGAREALAVDEREVLLCILPLFHTFAWIMSVLVIHMGAKMVLVSSLTPPTPWLKLMGRQGVTVFPAVPQLFAVLSQQAEGLKRLFLRYWCFRKVRMAISGSAPLSLETLQAFEEKLGVPILEGYGMTETSPVLTVNTLAARKPGTVGKLIPDVEIRIVDDAEKDVPAGEEGEIVARGPNVTKGYWNKPEASREAFTKDGWLKTGDIGRFDAEGFLRICDRKKDMIIVKGLKVFSAQIEHLLLEHPAVAEAAVIGVPDPVTKDEYVKAFVVLREGAQEGKHELLKFSRQKLDAYKRPRDIEVVASLPKNALQKVLKRELRKQELAKHGA